MSADVSESDRYLDFLQGHVRDLRVVLETLFEMEPWVSRDDFRMAFIENSLGQLYDDMFGDSRYATPPTTPEASA